jgi:signal transduction histidine kinase
MLTEVVKINERLADLVDDLLNVGRIEQGRIEVKPVEMDLGNLVVSVIKELQVQADAKNLKLTTNTQNLPKVKADPDRVKQVLVNLLGNAVKYTEKGQVKVTFEQDEKMVTCHVKDNGIGMKPEEQKHLFEQFYRVKNEKTRQIVGTGLGLWITKKIVEMMGGKIWVASVEGKGSTFSFNLPRI